MTVQQVIDALEGLDNDLEVMVTNGPWNAAFVEVVDVKQNEMQRRAVVKDAVLITGEWTPKPGVWRARDEDYR